jgi:hypothetical protein
MRCDNPISSSDFPSTFVQELLNKFLIGPHELPARFTAASYYHFLHGDQPLLVDNALDNMP